MSHDERPFAVGPINDIASGVDGKVPLWVVVDARPSRRRFQVGGNLGEELRKSRLSESMDVPQPARHAC